MLNFTDVEIVCIRSLAKAFLEGQTHSGTSDAEVVIFSIPLDNKMEVIAALESYGVVQVTTDRSHPPRRFDILPHAVTVAAEIDAQEKQRRDIMESVLYTLKRHPIAGWCFVALAVLTWFATMVSQIGGALKTFGIIK